MKNDHPHINETYHNFRLPSGCILLCFWGMVQAYCKIIYAISFTFMLSVDITNSVISYPHSPCLTTDEIFFIVDRVGASYKICITLRWVMVFTLRVGWSLGRLSIVLKASFQRFLFQSSSHCPCCCLCYRILSL